MLGQKGQRASKGMKGLSGEIEYEQSKSQLSSSDGVSGWLVVNHASSSSSVKVRDREDERFDSSMPVDAAQAEEGYQIQLALELSAREDPEAVQIEAVKQISLGSSV